MAEREGELLEGRAREREAAAEEADELRRHEPGPLRRFEATSRPLGAVRGCPGGQRGGRDLELIKSSVVVRWGAI